MTLSQRIKEYRYSKGWGPDELAGRASISRTALYQIECGRTEAPRAGTLCRIAKALGVGVDSLLGAHDASLGRSLEASGAVTLEPRGDVENWRGDVAGGATDAGVTSFPILDRSTSTDVRRAFDELLESPYSETISRIVTEMHRLVAGVRERNVV